jgi:UDP-N-acetylglucosamine 2-epimerase (non-hydrolysing)
LGFIDYNKLQIESKVVLSDSGTISEESSILGFKALNIREAHERPEAMEEAAVIMVGFSKIRILQSITMLDKLTKSNNVHDYLTVYLADKVIKIILSYTDYINKKVWFK